MKTLAQYHQTQKALGSDVELAIVTDVSASKIEAFFREKWQQIFQFERQFSRFLPGSELSIFNRSAGIRQPISPEFHNLLTATQKLMGQTNGLFNPFVLPVLQKVGYKQSLVPEYRDDQVDDHSHKSLVAIERLVIGSNWATIPYGTAIDLGGIGKGFLADNLLTSTPDWVSGLWYSVGGDIVTRGNNQSGHPWTVNISGESNLAYKMPESACAITTSGTLKRHGVHNGKSWHHIIDPRTGKSAESDILTATVVHKSVTQADVLATCAIILGSNHALSFLHEHDVTAALLQIQTNNTTKFKRFGRGFVTPTRHSGGLAT